MIGNSITKDLLVLTADTHMQSAVETLLRYRRPSLQISDIDADVIRHPDSDPGCLTASDKLLNPLRDNYHKMMVVFDFDGCGARNIAPDDLEQALERQFQSVGWTTDSVAFIVIAPELETWIFGASYRDLQDVVRWSQSEPMKDWFESEGHLRLGALKPEDPKAAIAAALNRQRGHISAKLFADLARRVSLARCQDRAFQKFRATLQRWFPAE